MKRRLTIYIFLIAAAAVVLSTAIGMAVFRQRELNAAQHSLAQMLALLDAQGERTDVERLLDEWEQGSPQLRLTFIAADGAVLGDSAAQELDDHSGRPEVEEALADGSGEDVRRSATTGVTTVYAARRFSDGIVGRAAQPVSSVDALVLQWGLGFGAAALLALGLALLLSRRLASSTAHPVEAAEEAVRQVDETLRSARSEFTANVTHELKTPLTSIKGFTDMLASGLVKDKADEQRFLSMISVETDRLSRLVDDILKVSELETVAGAVGGERAELLAAANEVGAMLAPQAAEAGVALSVQGGETVGAITPERFREVALNLMENAIKYNRPGGRVEVTVAQRDGQAVFTVADTGIGIPKESQSRVFERFYRVDKGRSRSAGGTGLGLAIVKHIVALYNGRIELDSAEGAGTTVTVTLPTAE